MNNYQRPKAILLLADGTIFEGRAVGKLGYATGELCFNTGMSGYQEIYSDPSYFGQLIVNTVAHIGNYGVCEQEQESGSAKFAGLICDVFAGTFSRNGASFSSLQSYLDKQNIVGIADLDTREIVRHIRHKGVMNALIASENTDDLPALSQRLALVPSMAGLELSSLVSTPQNYYAGDAQAPKKVAVLDLGIKTSILTCLAEQNIYCKVFGASSSFEEMEVWQPDGYFLSNGPGDPAAMPGAVLVAEQILAADKPLFGICLGHQILAQAVGIQTYKMKNGHRGLNHPVKNLLSGLCEITSQNHGFAVSQQAATQNGQVTITHINLNDHTIEGLRINDKKAFSVQYHPESSPGPHDSRYLFNQFAESL